MWTAWGHFHPISLKKELCQTFKDSGIVGQSLKILAINHTEEQHFLSNILGFSFSFFQVEPCLMIAKGIAEKKIFLSIKSVSIPVLEGGDGAGVRDILKIIFGGNSWREPLLINDREGVKN